MGSKIKRHKIPGRVKGRKREIKVREKGEGMIGERERSREEKVR